jgi:hypothetical protein
MIRLAILLLLAVSCRAQIDEARELAAIASVETGDHPEAVGSCGETGPVQLTPAMRAACHGDPFWLLADNRKRLAAIGLPDNPYVEALCWRLGITKLARREIPDSAVRYARRVRAAYTKSLGDGD